MNVEIGLLPRNFFSGNICFEFSVLVLFIGLAFGGISMMMTKVMVLDTKRVFPQSLSPL